MQKKAEILFDFCRENSIVINEGKNGFFVINAHNEDKLPLSVGHSEFTRTEKYTYLGTPMTADGRLSSALTEHARSKQAHVLKFAAFIAQNPDAPFVVKKQIMYARVFRSFIWMRKMAHQRR